jgi:hypothetical protein
MNNTKTAYPPFTKDDILTLRGQPMAKIVVPGKTSFPPQSEEWSYYNALQNIKEHYVFKNGRFVGYKTDVVESTK